MAADRSPASRRASVFPVLLLTLTFVGGAVVLGARRDEAPTSEPAPSPRVSSVIPARSPDAPRATPLASQLAMPPLLPMTTGKLAYSKDGDIYIAETDGSEPVLVTDSTGDDGYYEPRWSPDGRHLAYQRDGTLYVVDARGRSITTGEGCCFAWSPDSVRIASVVGGSSGGSGRPDSFTPEVEVIITSIAGSVVARLGLPNPSASFGNIVRVHWTPDGRSVVLSRVSGAPDGGRTWLVPLDFGAASAFPVEPAYASNGIFSPDGSLVVGVAFERVVLAAADGSAIRPLVAPKDLPDEGIGTNPTWSPDGHLIALGLGDGFTLVDVATGGVRHIWSPPPSPDPSISYASYVTGWSADGERLLVETYDPVSRGLWSVGIDGSDPQRLVAGEVVGGSWQWLPPES